MHFRHRTPLKFAIANITLSLLVCAALAPVSAGAAPVTAAAKPLTNIGGALAADIGVVDAADHSDAEHIFDLSNNTPRTLDLSGVHGTCGCERLKLLAGGKQAEGITLQPGDHFQVQLDVNLSGQPAGQITKSAFILGGPSHTAVIAALSLTFSIRRAVAFAPMRLDFGNLAAGESQSSSATVIIDKAVLGSATPPKLLSDSPFVTVGPAENPKDVVRDGKTAISKSYPVKLHAAPLVGPFRADLHLTLTSPSGVTMTADCPVSAQITGSMTVAPTTVYFGIVAHGAGAARTLIVTAKSLEDLKGLSVESLSPLITAKAHMPASGAATSTSCLVDISLSPQSRLGAFNSALLIRNGSNQIWNIPITAFIVAL